MAAYPPLAVPFRRYPMAPAPKPSPTKRLPTGPSPTDTLHELYADLSPAHPLDLRTPIDPWEARHARGKALRERTPRKSHARWVAPPDRPDPLALLDQSNQGRVTELIPIRMGRMAASRFGFLRGSAVVMAWDLAHTPSSGIQVLIDGDAHLSNFGLFGTVERDVVFDLNDFDEATIGPWEWDLKRLVTSVNVAGRDLGLDRAERQRAVEGCLEAYHREIRGLERRGALDVWYMFLFAARKNAGLHLDAETLAVIREATGKARHRTSATLLAQVARRGPGGRWRLLDNPPIQTRVSRADRRKIIDSLNDYALSLPRDRRYLLSRYRVVDVARRVIGVGSVGTRVYMVLMFGNGEDDPLFLQIKEGTVPAATPYVPALPEEFVAHQGRRVVTAQMGLNSSPDILLGWTRIDGRPFYVRQMRNMKGAVPVDELRGPAFPRYARACGAILARAHARSGDAAMIAGYWGQSRALDEALVQFAEGYGNQVEKDHARLLKAIAQGRVKAVNPSPPNAARAQSRSK